MATKKLRGKHTIEVDPQILRWRQKLRKEGIILAKAMARGKREIEQKRAERELERNGGLKMKKWYR